MTRPSPAEQLRRCLAQPGLLTLPGCFDAFSAMLIARAGYPAAYISGFGLSASALGLPDLGLMSFKEVLDRVAAIAAAVPLPLIADADTGYGNERNVRRTVREFARAGVAAIQLEDQVWPKRCGHTDGKAVIALTEGVDKIAAAADVAAEQDILVVARTDARAVEGYEAAVERCNAYAAAGADIIFCEAPGSAEEIADLPRRVSAPLLINLVEGGKTPLLPPQRLADLGYRLAIQPISLLLAATDAMRRQLRPAGAELRPALWQGTTSFSDLRDILGFDSDNTHRPRTPPQGD